MTFQVDMSQYEGAFGTVNLNGNFAGWCGSCIEMSDDNGDGIYIVTVELSAGQIEYKFTLDGWSGQEEFAGGESCTVTDGTFVNRGYEVVGEAILDVVCYNSCDACPEEAFSIQAAIDQAAEGSTIEIPAGDYAESLVINKGLVLTSASGTGCEPLPAKRNRYQHSRWPRQCCCIEFDNCRQ